MNQKIQGQQRIPAIHMYSKFALSEQLRQSQQRKMLLLDKIGQKLKMLQKQSHNKRIIEQNLKIFSLNRAKVQQMSKITFINPQQKNKNPNLNHNLYEKQIEKINLLQQNYQYKQKIINLKAKQNTLTEFSLKKDLIDLQTQQNFKRQQNQSKSIQIQINQKQQLQKLQIQLQTLKKNIQQNSSQIFNKRNDLLQLNKSIQNLKAKRNEFSLICQSLQQKKVQQNEAMHVYSQQLIKLQAQNKNYLSQINFLEESRQQLLRKEDIMKMILRQNKINMENLQLQRRKIMRTSHNFQSKRRQLHQNIEYLMRCKQKMMTFS